jgi:uncharacterized membrane protein YkoI
MLQRRPTAMRLAAGALCLALGSVALPAWADGRQDHEIARRALAAGEILPLRTLLQRLERTHPGEVLEVELEQKSGRWLYEVKLLSNDGGVSKLLLDASDATLIEIKGPRTGKHDARKPSETRP